MWMNFLLRTYSWMSILENTGLLNTLFQKIGLLSLVNHVLGTNFTYFPMINTQGAIVLGMVYNYLPFMILPIFTVIEKIDPLLIEAAQDLGANSAVVFRKLIFPLSVPGILSGITMVFVPSVATFAISRLLGGGMVTLLGDLIETQFLGGAYNPYLGSAISLVMMIIVLVCMEVIPLFPFLDVFIRHIIRVCCSSNKTLCCICAVAGLFWAALQKLPAPGRVLPTGAFHLRQMQQMRDSGLFSFRVET